MEAHTVENLYMGQAFKKRSNRFNRFCLKKCLRQQNLSWACLRKCHVRENGSCFSCRITTGWVTSNCCSTDWNSPVSVMLLMPEGFLSDTRAFLAKDTYAGETEWRRVEKPHQRPTVWASRIGYNWILDAECSQFTVNWQAAELHQTVDFRPGKITSRIKPWQLCVWYVFTDLYLNLIF